MEDNKAAIDEKVASYKEQLTPFLKYIPYFKEKSEVSKIYAAEGSNDSISFPVYDSVFLTFIKEIKNTSFMDRNYRYVYTRNHIKSHEDEDDIIAKATLKNWNTLCGILSYYVLGGATRPSVWGEGGKANVYGKCLEKMKDIINYYDISYGRDFE